MAFVLEPGSFDALIFDCDGTLVDSSALYLHALQRVFKDHGLDMGAGWYLARPGLTPVDLMTAYAKEIAPVPNDRASLLAQTMVVFQNNLHTLQEVSLVADVVRQWHGKVPLAVASNGPKNNVRGSLEAVGLLPMFDTIVTPEDVKHGKPAPDVYLEAARRLGIQPVRCIVFEDSDEGLQAARSAEMSTIDVRPFLSRH